MAFQSILTYLAAEHESSDVLQRAARLARETGARLTFVDVLKPLPVYLREPTYGYPALSETVEKEATERLEAIAEPLRQTGLSINVTVLTGKPHEEIAREVLRKGHDLVIAPTEPEGMTNLSATTSVRLCRLSPAPVLAIRDGGSGPFQRILATVDPLSQDEEGNELNRRVIETALETARLEDGEVSVLFVWGENLPQSSLEAHGESIRQLAESALKDLLEPYAEAIDPDNVLLEFGDPAPTICRIAREREMDLVVLGTIARSGVQALWIGNTAEKTLGDLDISILAIKPSKFVSPVEL